MLQPFLLSSLPQIDPVALDFAVQVAPFDSDHLGGLGNVFIVFQKLFQDKTPLELAPGVFQ
jgi:hypothetical protein